MAIRKIVQIDEELCDGCGNCIPGCAEGALEIVDGKAKIVKDMYCDGLGACLGHCPQGALTVIERDADQFDEKAALDHVRATRGEEGVKQMLEQNAQHEADSPASPAAPLGCGCPGSSMQTFERKVSTPCPCSGDDEQPASQSALGHWPVQIRLIPPHAPFLKGADLVIAADCAPVAVADFNKRFVDGKAIMIGCPKFDDVQDYFERFKAIFKEAQPASVTVVRMEVPCCTGLSGMVHRAAAEVDAQCEIKDVVISTKGAIMDSKSLL